MSPPSFEDEKLDDMLITLEGPSFARKEDVTGKLDQGRYDFIDLLLAALRQGADRISVQSEQRALPSWWEQEMLNDDPDFAEMLAEYRASPDFDNTVVRGLFYLQDQRVNERYGGGARDLFTELKKHVGSPFSVDLNMLVDELQLEFYPTNQLGENLWARYRSMPQKSYEVAVSVEPETRTATITLQAL